jgi:hypothetical protein
MPALCLAARKGPGAALGAGALRAGTLVRTFSLLEVLNSVPAAIEQGGMNDPRSWRHRPRPRAFLDDLGL